MATSNRFPPTPEVRVALYSRQLEDIDSQRWMCCINCESWLNKAEECNKYKMRPPALVIATGCETWTGDIPF